MTGIAPMFVASTCADKAAIRDSSSLSTFGFAAAVSASAASAVSAVSSLSAVSSTLCRSLVSTGSGLGVGLGLRLGLGSGSGSGSRARSRKKADLERRLRHRMAVATIREEWELAARELDMLEGNTAWKLDRDTGELSADVIEQRLMELNTARARGDVKAMTHLIRTALSRDLGGMGQPALYRRCYVGTKVLVERYVEAAIRTIDAVVDSASSPPIGSSSSYTLKTATPPSPDWQRDLLDAMLSARQSFGRSALLLSGGGTLGMAHIGVVKALFEARLLPRIISGASAGSIVCAVLCTRTDDEIPELVLTFPGGDMAVFDDSLPDPSSSSSPRPSAALLGHLRLLLTEGSWADIKHLIRVMRGLVGDMTFQEAYNRTRRILNICVSTASVYELPRLLNYITAPNVLIWSAVAASCSVPLVFGPASLLVKVPVSGAHVPWDPTPRCWIDGSVDNDLPMTRLAEMFNVNHFIVSQVNPHVVPFLSRHERGFSASSSSSRYFIPPFVSSVLAELAKDEVLHRLHVLAELGILPNLATKVRSILSQKYSGDITILPELGLRQLPLILSNPTPDFMRYVALEGERATWPNLDRIRDRCAIELALDRAVHRLRARVVFSTSQVELRRLATSQVELRSLATDFPPWMVCPGSSVPGHEHSSPLGLANLPATAVTAPGADETTHSSRDRSQDHNQSALRPNYHHRRRSGGSLHLRHTKRRAAFLAELQHQMDNQQVICRLDDDEEVSSGQAYHRRHRLRRRPRSYFDMRLTRCCPSDGLETSGPRYQFGSGLLAAPAHDLEQRHNFFSTPAASVAITSPSEDVETSAEDRRWSDADEDYSGTEEDDINSDGDIDMDYAEHGNQRFGISQVATKAAI